MSYKIMLVQDDLFYSQLLQSQLYLNPDNNLLPYSTTVECLAALNSSSYLTFIDCDLADLKINELLSNIQIHTTHETKIIICNKNVFAEAKGILAQDVDSYVLKDIATVIFLLDTVIELRKISLSKNDFKELDKQLQVINYGKTLKEYTTEIIAYYLKKYDQNVVQVAIKLDIGKSTIYNMIKSGEITLNK